VEVRESDTTDRSTLLTRRRKNLRLKSSADTLVTPSVDREYGVLTTNIRLNTVRGSGDPTKSDCLIVDLLVHPILIPLLKDSGNALHSCSHIIFLSSYAPDPCRS